MNLLRDYKSSKLICEGKLVLCYGQVYHKTNENLVDPLIKIDFKNKDVLAPMGSGDQVFTSNLLGAKSTDAFDRNILTYYYFFLRQWTINYFNELYPEELLDNDYKWLYKLLMEVKPKSNYEMWALKYWANHFKDRTNIAKMFFEDQIEGKTLFTTADELKDFASLKINFSLIDFFKAIETKKKYNILMFSNIFELDKDKEKTIRIIRDNFLKLLKEDGIVLCSSIKRRTTEELEIERRIILTDFDFEEIDSKHYVYKKKNR